MTGEQRVVVEITSEIGSTGAKLYLIGRPEGTLGRIFEDAGPAGAAGPPDVSRAVLHVERIVVSAGSPPAADPVGAAKVLGPMDLTLARPIDVPGGLVTGDGDVRRLRTAPELRDELAAQAKPLRLRFHVLVEEAQRRLLAIDLAPGVSGSAFLGVASPPAAVAAKSAGHARVRLWTVATVEDEPSVRVEASAELTVHARVSARGVERTLALVCALDAVAGARLRVHVDDFNLSLPEFALPTFEPFEGMPRLLELVNRTGAARVLSRLGVPVGVVLDGNPRLALRQRTGGGIDWALVTPEFDVRSEADWSDVRPKLAELAAHLVVAQRDYDGNAG